MTALAIWLAASPLVALLAGCFIRVGMVESDHAATPQEG